MEILSKYENIFAASIAMHIGTTIVAEILSKIDNVDFVFADYSIVDLRENWKEMVEAVIGERIEEKIH